MAQELALAPKPVSPRCIIKLHNLGMIVTSRRAVSIRQIAVKPCQLLWEHGLGKGNLGSSDQDS
jgi:hypothetical protein